MSSILDAVAFTVSLAALVGAFFLSQSLTRRATAGDSSTYVSRSLAQKAHISCVVVGVGGLVWAGAYAILRWMPGSWDEFRWTVSAFAAFATVPLVSMLSTLPSLRRDYEALLTISVAERKRIERATTPTESEISLLDRSLQDRPHTREERLAVVSEIEFLRVLRRRDETLIQRYQRQLEVQAEEAKGAAELERRNASEAAARAAEQARVAFLKEAVPRLLRPASPSRAAPEIGDAREVLVPVEVVRSAWKVFTLNVLNARPQTAEAAEAAGLQVRVGLAALEGVHVHHDLQVLIDYHGNERDGFADVIAHCDGQKTPLSRAVTFDETFSGLLNALFLSDWLVRGWSWGHGLYDRDFDAVSETEHLVRLLHDVKLPEHCEWPTPGVRIQRREDTISVSYLASRPGLGIFDCSVALSAGALISQHREKVFVWGGGVLY